jgi:predicted ArsR family transcriptional regulator
VTIKKDDKRAPAKTNMQKRRIIEYLSNQSEGRVSDLADMLGVSTSRVKKLIYDLIAEDAITAEGSNKNRIYKLKI